MLEQLRWQLTLWFVGLSILLYSGLSLAAFLVFESGLTNLMDDELRVVAREVRPAIEYSGSLPSLKTWASSAKAHDIELLASVQLYDNNKQLTEEYGPNGITDYIDGNTTQRDPHSGLKVRSRSVPLNNSSEMRPIGFLQVQLPTREKEAAMQKLFSTFAILAPFLLAALGVCGYWFASKALQPTVDSLRLLRRFVADAGHEFTTPVSVILASVETLEKQALQQGSETETLSVISRAAERMSRLAKDLVMLAKMERPQSISPLTPVFITKLVESVIEELEGAALEKNIKIEMHCLQSIKIWAQEESLRTLILNLLKNAIIYTESGGHVTIALEKIGSHVQFIIDDTGIGIPSESLPLIFDRFYRVDQSRSRSGGGSGLGLSIVKAIVEAHQGTIKVESSVRRGSRFTVILPNSVTLSNKV